MNPTRSWSDIDGILLLDKDTGMSSNAALQQAKRLLNARKAGHTGSLDPLASGLLPICLGEATKLAGFLLDTDKRYRVSIQLGSCTDTADAEGKTIDENPVPALDAALIEQVLDGFRGRTGQIPPMYSALKHHGTRLYELARRGISIDRERRQIDIHELRLLSFGTDTLELDVHCSKGTYIRVLAEDIGRTLGCGGHVTSLRRTAVGGFSVDRALTLAALRECDPMDRIARLQPMDLMVAAFPVVELDDELCFLLRRGQKVPFAAPGLPGPVRLYDRNHVLFGIGDLGEDRMLAPRRLFASSTPGAASQRQNPARTDAFRHDPNAVELVHEGRVKLK